MIFPLPFVWTAPTVLHVIAVPYVLGPTGNGMSGRRPVLNEYPGRAGLPIQTRQLDTEMQKAQSQLRLGQAKVLDAQRGAEVERTAIRAIPVCLTRRLIS